MMGERRVDQAKLFYEFSLERHVPQDHRSAPLIASSIWTACGRTWRRSTARLAGLPSTPN